MKTNCANNRCAEIHSSACVKYTGSGSTSLGIYCDDALNPVLDALIAKVEELEEAYNEQIKSAIELKKELNEHKKFEAIYAACEGLTQTQVEKMKSLAESIEFTTEDEFTEKMETLKESYFKNPVVSADSSALDDEVQIEEEKKVAKSSDPLMEVYSKAISQTVNK